MEISIFEHFLNKSINSWNPDDLGNLFKEYSGKLSISDILNILNEVSDPICKNLIQSTLISQNFEVLFNKIISYRGSDDFENKIKTSLKSSSYIERIHAWCEYVSAVPNFDFALNKDIIKEDTEKYIENLIELAKYENITLTSKLLDLLFLFINIYYYKSGEDICDIYSHSEIKNILERINYETKQNFPFLATENLSSYPDIFPEDLGLMRFK